MSTKKVATMNMRVEPRIKDAVKKAADREHRSMANFIEFLILNYYEQAGIAIPNKQDIFEGASSR